MNHLDSYKVAEGVDLDILASVIKQNNSKNAKSKKAKKGGFLLFVEEHTEIWRNEGKDVSTLSKAIQAGDQEWRNLSTKEKNNYKKKACPTSDVTDESSVSIDFSENKPEEVEHMERYEFTNPKQLSIIYEEDEPDLLNSSSDQQEIHSKNEVRTEILHSAEDIELPTHFQKVCRSNVRNLKYPLRRPSNESLKARRNLDFENLEESTTSSAYGSSEDCHNKTPLSDCLINYDEVKSSSPIKDIIINSNLLDISPIKGSISPTNEIECTASSGKSMEEDIRINEHIKLIEKILQKANDIMDDSSWDKTY